MTNEEIRARILEDHEEIRGILDELGRLNRRFAHEADVGDEIRALGVGLLQVFVAHLSLEDSLLLPLLEAAPGDGSQLAERLDREHGEQRALLHFIFERLEHQRQPTTVMARELDQFAEYVRTDMAHEEETILRVGLLT